MTGNETNGRIKRYKINIVCYYYGDLSFKKWHSVDHGISRGNARAKFDEGRYNINLKDLFICLFSYFNPVFDTVRENERRYNIMDYLFIYFLSDFNPIFDRSGIYLHAFIYLFIFRF